MSRPRKGALPTYRLHKARNCAVVTIDGHDHYLGPFGSPSSKQKYAALIRAWQQRQEQPAAEPDAPLVPNDGPTVNELILAYLKHARDYYRLNHGENKEAGCINDALAVLQEQGYGREPGDAFRPRDLKKVREAMVAKNWARTYVNSQVNRVKRMFAFAVEEDLIPGTVYHALLAVKGLRKGTPGVRETKKVRPVPRGDIKPVLARAHAVLKAMLLFAYRTGARPGEVCALKPCHLDRTGKVWIYRVPPDANKTEHHDQERKVYVGPRARKILETWLEGIAPDEFVFSPARAERLRQNARRDARKTPLYPSHLRRLEAKRREAPKRPKRDHYDPTSIRRAVKRLCEAVGVPTWTPNRLRHNAATRFRKMFGIEVARLLLGHRKLTTTEIYAEPNARKARRAALDLG
ncbi:MAG: tyrosine-type recombinase/integrase [Gemmataceae bacterium]